MKIAVFDTKWGYTIDTPYTEPLGGTQSAICYFLEEMKIRGHNVYLFNNIKTQVVSRGVEVIPAQSYLQYSIENKIEYDIVIISCIAEEIMEIKINLSNMGISKTIFCLWTGHDMDQPASATLNQNKIKDFIDLYIFVSRWQLERYIEKFNINTSKCIVMRNGIGKCFEKYLNLPSNKIKNSSTYCSVPWRGLELLVPIFKQIKTKHTDASLKIFSGMNIYRMPENGAYDMFKTMDDVEYNYGVSQEKLAEELYKIEYHTYPNIFQETSCITVLQAMACGCIVITSNMGALKETMNGMGNYIDINRTNFDKDKYVENFINTLDSYMMLPENIKEVFRQQNKEYIKNNYTWGVICERFEKDIDIFTTKHTSYMQNYKQFLNDGTIKFSQGNHIDALKTYCNIINFPNINEYYIIKLNMGVSLFNLGKNDEAISYLKSAKELKDDFNVNKNIAAIELTRGNVNKFMKYAKLALNYEYDTYLANLLAEKVEQSGYYHEVIGIYESILRLEPYNVNCLNNLGNLYLLFLSNSDSYETKLNELYNKSLEISIRMNETRKKELIISNIIFNNLYNWKLSEAAIYDKAIEYPKYIIKETEIMEIAKTLENKQRGIKIRVGYISTDFCTHPVGFMFESILKHHDIERFEIFCYDNTNKIQDITSIKLRNYNKATWHNIFDMSDKMIVKQMVDDNLDILVDMMGHTRNNRMSVLQYKPARKIISYFAYPSTSGIMELDYKITDKYANPPETQQYFTEKFIYLPNGFQCYTPPQEIDGTKRYERGKYSIHLACFNNPTKLSIPTIETFAEILKRLPEAKLFLRYCYYKSSYYKENILRLFMKYGVERERIDIGFEPLLDALRQYNNMDIVLDPFPYNGGTISSEALYMNTPFITLAGTNYVSRVGVSLLSNMGLEQYIANTHEEYITKVVDLARNPSELKCLHQMLRIKMKQTDLANAISFTKHIEEAYMNINN